MSLTVAARTRCRTSPSPPPSTVALEWKRASCLSAGRRRVGFYPAATTQGSIKADTVTEIAVHDPARFTPGAAGFLTQDEESSGIIDASRVLGPGWFIATVQAHYPIAGELVEGGQLFALYNPASDPQRDGHPGH